MMDISQPLHEIDARSVASESTIYRKILWRTMPLIFLCYIVNYLDRINISIAKLQMQGDIGLSNSTYALGASMFFWGVLCFDFPSNLIMHRVGARVWIARIMISWGIVSSAVAFIEPIGTMLGIDRRLVFYVLRFMLGMSEAGFFSGIVLYISYWLPSRRQSEMLAVFLLALPVSSVVGAPLSGWLIDALNGAGKLHGWQWMLLLEGIPAVLLGLAVLRVFHDGPAHVDWLTELEKAVVRKNLAGGTDATAHKLSAALTDLRIWIMCAIYLTYATGFFGLAFWLPTIINQAGIRSAFHVGLLSAIPYAVSALAMVWHARHAKRTGERRLHTVVPLLAGGVGLMLSAVFLHQIAIAIVCLAVAVSGLMCAMTIFWTLPSGFLSGAAAAGGIAVIFTVGNFSGILGSFISSIALDLTGSTRNGTYLLGAMMIVSGCIAWVAPKSIFGIRPDS